MRYIEKHAEPKSLAEYKKQKMHTMMDATKLISEGDYWKNKDIFVRIVCVVFMMRVLLMAEFLP